MLSIIRREFTLRRNLILIFGIIIIVLVSLYTPLYPSIQANSSKFNQLINAFGNIYKDVGIEGTVAFNNLENYMSTELFGLTWPILVIVFVIGLSGSTLAGEIETGSFGMLLAQPVNRTVIYLAKFMSGIIGIATLVILSSFTIPLIAIGLGIHFRISHFFSIALLGLLFATAVYSIGMMISAASNIKGRVYGLTGVIILIMYVSNIVAGLRQSLGGLKYISLFHYFNAGAALGYNHISSVSIYVFLGVIVVCNTLGAIILNKRDVII